ncbi:MAG: M48 family metallopeptidase [Oscillospiraceae bacterium]|nr:M48 family metallopeptidase [Oscillospiraceae bacterium]
MSILEYEIIRSSRRTLALTVNKNGGIVVRAPMNMPESRITAFVEEKQKWLEKHSSAAGARSSRRAERLSQPPHELPFLGELYPVDHTQPYGYSEGRFHLPENMPLESLLPMLKKLYSSLARDTLPTRTRLTAERMGITLGEVKISSAKTRWGSCSADKNINLSWKLMAADMRLIDYVIVHELCHIRQMNHSAAFWENVRAVIPDYEERRECLKKVQETLSEYGLD